MNERYDHFHWLELPINCLIRGKPVRYWVATKVNHCKNTYVTKLGGSFCGAFRKFSTLLLRDFSTIETQRKRASSHSEKTETTMEKLACLPPKCALPHHSSCLGHHHHHHPSLINIHHSSCKPNHGPFACFWCSSNPPLASIMESALKNSSNHFSLRIWHVEQQM